MNIPIDFPTYARRADADQDTIFTAVGRTMSMWESLEFEFSRLYCVFVGDPDGVAMQEYGSGQISRVRLDNLHDKANLFFTRNPSQEFEGDYQLRMSLVQFYADRRNEVAHGIAMDVSGLSLFRALIDPTRTGNFLLIPPYYLLRKHYKNGAPHYAYSSAEINRLAEIIFMFQMSIRDFRERLSPPLAPLSP